MFELRKFVAPEFVFGQGALALIGRYATNFGARKPLVVTDTGVISAGWARRVIGELERVGLEYAVFSGVSQNPRDTEVMAGAAFYAQHGCDLIVAVGGGSPMDCAKAIGIVCTNRLDVREFEGVDRVAVPGPPLICVPTTAGTSADVSQFAIINDSHRRMKFAIISKTMVPDVALIDPETTLTMDPYLTACTGLDALVHAIEAIVSTAHSPITDIHAFQAIRLIRNNLLPAIHEGDNRDARDMMMLASMEAGLAFSNASLGAVHAMAHALGGLKDMPHGECNAILLWPVIEGNYDSAPDRYREVAVCLGIETEGKDDASVRDALRETITALRSSAGVTATLSQRGVEREELADLARTAARDPCMITNPRQMTEGEIEGLYERAM
jgi:alcohol dehydrogenase class IV